MKKIYLHQGDIPHNIQWGESVAVDTETMGLNPFRDRLCLVQLRSAHGETHIVQFQANSPYQAPNLQKLFADESILKIFHFARFDIGFLYRFLHVMPRPLYCTKIASKLCRTYTDRHGLKELVKEILSIELEKETQTSDWGASVLTQKQIDYAAQDVLHLHDLKAELDVRLAREHRVDLAGAAFEFLPFRAALDLLGLDNYDIFSH